MAQGLYAYCLIKYSIPFIGENRSTLNCHLESKNNRTEIE